MNQREWREVRQALLEHQGVRCAVCKKEESAPRRVYAHEGWEYRERPELSTATITGVSLLCWHCHAVEHWGVTNRLVAQGNLTQRAIDDTIAHFCRLNNATEDDFRAHVAEAGVDWDRQNGLKWHIDYGPFEPWVVPWFNRDPLNECDWPTEIAERYIDAEAPEVFQLVSAMLLAERTDE